jgi:class 3 adenylate cyclase
VRFQRSTVGIRDKDLVWIGRAANHAEKLTAIPVDPSIWITKDVYDNINQAVKFCDGVDMWVKRSWTQMNGAEIYCSTYTHTFPN